MTVIDLKGGPRGTWHKKIQNIDSMQLESGPKGLRDFRSTIKDVSI
jgi:hypothetical protein